MSTAVPVAASTPSSAEAASFVPPLDAPPADVIRARMRRVRHRMDGDVTRLVARSQRLLDWRHYVGKHPVPVLGAAAAAAFMLMPGRRGSRIVVSSPLGAVQYTAPSAKPAEPTMLGLAGGFVASLAIRAAMGYLTRRVGTLMESNSFGAKD